MTLRKKCGRVYNKVNCIACGGKWEERREGSVVCLRCERRGGNTPLLPSHTSAASALCSPGDGVESEQTASQRHVQTSS